MKIGVIACIYGNSDYIEPCLKPWIELKKELDIKISIVHGQFKEYHDLGVPDDDRKTQEILLHNKYEDYLYTQNNYWMTPKDKYIYQTEAEIRNEGLKPLLKENCDIIWLLDNDERYTVEEIKSILNYIESGDNPFYAWYSIHFKNYILDGKQWVDGFCPPRIFRVKTMNFTSEAVLNRFYWDNDVEYKTSTGSLKGYKNFSDKVIPRKYAHIKHLTWLHENGKDKVNYQLKHFGHCSYQWNEEKKELEFNLDFYRKNGLELPIIYHE